MRKIPRFKIFLLLALSATLLQCADRPQVSVKNEMNVLLITIDTLRADHLGCYGYTQHVSPSIDALAHRGVLFSNCISQCPMTPTSHASILTGQDPYRHGVREFLSKRLKRDTPTLATLLKNAGYQTAAFVSAYSLEKQKYGLDNGFDVYDQSFCEEQDAEHFDQEKQRVNSQRQQNPVQRRADLTASLAVDWLRRIDKRPFFLWVHYFDPHETVLVPPIIPGLFEYSVKGPLTPVHLQMYDVEIRFVDLILNTLTSELFKMGLGQNTLIVLTSDHGQGLDNHNYEYHTRALYQEQIHIPLILAGKPIPVGVKVDALARSTDILPTVLDILGYPDDKIPLNFDGRSLRTFWENTGREKPAEVTAYSETLYSKLRSGGSPMYSMIDGDMKLIYHAEAQYKNEMYDLARDPLEMNNIFTQQPKHAKKLIGEINSLLKGTTISTQRAKAGQDKDWENKLKSLGYMN
ncbi:sulfatase [Candidatus Poribacteria bacterium]|nr:sulfatase [Candidatus Poribacteria bacterium]